MSIIITTSLGRFRQVVLDKDGHEAFLFECPGCGQWAYLDEDQWNGRVSVDHATDGCPGRYHETHEYGKTLVAAIIAAKLLGGQGIERGDEA